MLRLCSFWKTARAAAWWRTGVLLAVCAGVPARAQLSFNLVPGSGVTPEVLAGFQAAAAEWSAVFSDPITITLNIGYNTSPGTGVLGSTSSGLFTTLAYSDFRAALTHDRTSAADYTAVASLPVGSSYSLLLNHPGVANSTGNGSGDTLTITVANARALGLYQASGGYTDASITFNSSFAFDFNPANGIDAGKYDFVGVAAHEIGHALGFYSGVDYLDQHPGVDWAQTWQTPLDFFRFSAESTAAHEMDGAADTRAKYFSIDGGLTNLGNFSTGVTYGDGRQASHWKDDSGLGILDPTASTGEVLQISALDLRAFDVIGYNLSSVPEPAQSAVALALLAFGWAGWRRRRSVD